VVDSILDHAQVSRLLPESILRQRCQAPVSVLNFLAPVEFVQPDLQSAIAQSRVLSFSAQVAVIGTESSQAASSEFCR
jgi:hypothetical protein